MPIKAQVIEHSVSVAGKEILTLELQYPRFIHGEIMTHRVFSRNAASSRAIPVKKMLEQVKDNPVVPHHWGKNEPGMQAREEISLERREEAVYQWQRAAEHAAYFAEQLHGLGVHKQIVNRLLEPFQWMRTIATSTEWDNFFDLRRHEAAEPHFQLLANAIYEAKASSAPVLRGTDATNVYNWHLPYVMPEERAAFGREMGDGAGFVLSSISAARCARVSYLTHDGRTPQIEEDLKLFQRLAGGRPIHASPLEHQAFPHESAEARFGNFVGWVQFRKLFEAQQPEKAEEVAAC